MINCGHDKEWTDEDYTCKDCGQEVVKINYGKYDTLKEFKIDFPELIYQRNKKEL